MPKRATSVNPANKRRAKKPIKRRKKNARAMKRELYQRSKPTPGNEADILWKGGKSASINYQSLGLQYNLNPKKRLVQNSEGKLPFWIKEEKDVKVKVEKVQKVADKGGVLPEEKYVSTGKQKRLSEDDIKYCKKLVDKYGDDTRSMFRDIKLNILQWSEGEIAKKLKIYHLRHEDEMEE
mmetsp:Transcript_39519/g.45379  ORF Transcript_39519/g.45379 Transcript_39519/m.45379 type:complete len:180 (-) Transcript_39519:70-609(-)